MGFQPVTVGARQWRDMTEEVIHISDTYGVTQMFRTKVQYLSSMTGRGYVYRSLTYQSDANGAVLSVPQISITTGD